MIINDDLGAFGDLVTQAGRAAARGENALMYTLLNANGALSDGVAMFHANHANLAGSGTAITVAAIGAGRAAMRKQKNIGGSETLNLTPSILLVGPDKETEAEQFLASIVAAQSSNVNPFAGKLKPVADAAISGNTWHLFADPADAPNFIYGYVGDAEGPMITQERPFGVDGMALQVLHDFGGGAIDYRGGYKNAGA
jgi:phage major head subunit gpT-like protein